MRTRIIITLHAARRFDQRFQDLIFKDEFASAVAFGGQLGKSSRLLISKNNVVFVMSNYMRRRYKKLLLPEYNYEFVSTVLSKEFALANMQYTHKISWHESDTIVEETITKPSKISINDNVLESVAKSVVQHLFQISKDKSVKNVFNSFAPRIKDSLIRSQMLEYKLTPSFDYIIKIKMICFRILKETKSEEIKKPN